MCGAFCVPIDRQPAGGLILPANDLPRGLRVTILAAQAILSSSVIAHRP
jgi:hypothetical protein